LGVKTENFTAPIAPLNITIKARLVDAGNDHTLLYGDDGYLYTFGKNNVGQLGNGLSGNNAQSSFPVRVNFTLSPDEVVKAVGTSWSDYCVILVLNKKTAITTLYSWGHHFDGYLGLGELGSFGRNQSTPRAVKMNNLQNEVVVQLNVADTHTLILTQSGKVFGWGDNSFGQIGDGGVQTKTEPTAVLLTSLATKTVMSISAQGGYHSFILTTDGSLFGWGRNDVGQLGDGTTTNKLTAVPILGLLSGKVVTSVVGGADHTLVYTTESKLYAMGGNDFGQCGNRSISGPVASGAVESIAMNQLFYKLALWPSKIYAGSQTSYFLFSNGWIYSIGNNGWGQLGDGTQKTNILGSKLRTDNNGDFFQRQITDLAVGQQHVVVIASGAFSLGISMLCFVVIALIL